MIVSVKKFSIPCQSCQRLIVVGNNYVNLEKRHDSIHHAVFDGDRNIRQQIEWRRGKKRYGRPDKEKAKAKEKGEIDGRWWLLSLLAKTSPNMPRQRRHAHKYIFIYGCINLHTADDKCESAAVSVVLLLGPTRQTSLPTLLSARLWLCLSRNEHIGTCLWHIIFAVFRSLYIIVCTSLYYWTWHCNNCFSRDVLWDCHYFCNYCYEPYIATLCTPSPNVRYAKLTASNSVI